MITDIKKLDERLSNIFKRILAIAIFSLFSAITGAIVAFSVSYDIGYIISLISILVGVLCIAICLLLRVFGKHLK